MPTIWVDGDGCPNAIKEILYRGAQRTKIPLVIVANHGIRVPASRFIKCMQVPQGFDVADDEIVRQVKAGDLVITSDIALADEIISKGAEVVTSKGQVLDKNNIKLRLNVRDFMDTMRASGINTKGPPPLSASDRAAFANAFDRWLTSQQPR